MATYKLARSTGHEGRCQGSARIEVGGRRLLGTRYPPSLKLRRGKLSTRHLGTTRRDGDAATEDRGQKAAMKLGPIEAVPGANFIFLLYALCSMPFAYWILATQLIAARKPLPQ